MLRLGKVISALIAAALLLPSFPAADAQTTTPQNSPLWEVEEAIARAQAHLLALQNEQGHWDGDCVFHIASDPDLMGTTGFYLYLLSHMGINNPNRRQAVEYLLAAQLPDGGWGLSPAGNYLDTLALEQAGIAPASPTLQRAYEYLEQLQTQGQTLDTLMFFIQSFYALAGKYPWEKIEFPLIENIDAQLSTPKKPNPFILNQALDVLILNTLHVEGGPSREQRQLLRRAEALLIQGQLPNGSWFDCVHATVNALLGLYELGYDKNDEHIVQGLRYLANMQREDGSIALFEMPVLDTALALLALEASGLNKDGQEIQQAVQWLIDSRKPSGGWGWTAHSGSATTAIDDTTLVTAILADHGLALTDEAVAFLLSWQNDDGGWGSFGRDPIAQKDVQWIPPVSEDVELNFIGDPSMPDCTGQALLALGRAGYTTEDENVESAIAYLKRVQFDNGMWFGLWGTPYSYGSTNVLMGLAAVGADMGASYVQNTVQWLTSCQNADGGWGEDLKASEGPEYAGQGASTASQTARTILGLLSANVAPDSEAIQNGIAYLVAHQRDDGSWEPARTMLATSPFPYAFADTSWALWALSVYRTALQGPGQDVASSDYRLVGLFVALLVGLSLLGLYAIVRRSRAVKSSPR